MSNILGENVCSKAYIDRKKCRCALIGRKQREEFIKLLAKVNPEKYLLDIKYSKGVLVGYYVANVKVKELERYQTVQ